MSLLLQDRRPNSCKFSQKYAASLSDEDILKYKDRFRNIEIYTNREILKSYWNKFEEGLNLMKEEYA